MEYGNFLSDEEKSLIEKERQKKIKKEIQKLNKIFADLDKNKLIAISDLIHRAAFMVVTLAELEETINREGCTCEYKNGENQYGTKKSPEVEIHIAMAKNYAAVIKQLTELIPAEKRKESKLAALRNE